MRHYPVAVRTYVCRPKTFNPYRVVNIRCACGITVNSSLRYAWKHWWRHVKAYCRDIVR